MRPIPDILAENELGLRLSTQIQEIENIKNNVPCFAGLDVSPFTLPPYYPPETAQY
jgi:hypothetical protein